MSSMYSTDGGAALRPNTRVVLRPLGSPLPLGILALVPSSVTLSIQQLGGIPVSETASIGLLLVAFVFPLQIVAAILAFLGRDSPVATGLGLFAGAWLATGLSLLTAAPGARSKSLGIFLICAGACLLAVVTGAASGKLGTAIVLVVGGGRFIVTGLYELLGGTGLEHAAAIIGLTLAGAALYSAVVTLLEDASGETKLPLARRNLAADALDASFERQLDRLEHEAGVRQQL